MVRPGLKAVLYADPGGWGLPTIDADGLAAHALLRFGNIEYASVPAISPSMTPANKLPVVVFNTSPEESDQVMSAGLASLIGLFTANRSLPDLNHHLTPFMAAESTAFATLVTSRFEPARLHEFYIDDDNYSDIYHTLLQPQRAWPLNRVLPFMRRRTVRQILGNASSETLLFDAGIVLAALSTRLGDRSKYFYGDQPSILDAVVFGQLASALLVPLPHARLRALVAGYSNLIAFVERIRNVYFANDSEEWTRRLDPEDLAEVRRQEAQRRAQADSAAAAAAERERQQHERSSSESQEEADRKKGNVYFIWASVAVFAAHLLLGNEIEFSFE